mmetsp:Transcript_77850/g.217634  ORF Transcript_77850/g.217634 Transcript_77850/m.217634 type:complete len:328 (-) Transcript_77850:983-1966(-)
MAWRRFCCRLCPLLVPPSCPGRRTAPCPSAGAAGAALQHRAWAAPAAPRAQEAPGGPGSWTARRCQWRAERRPAGGQSRLRCQAARGTAAAGRGPGSASAAPQAVCEAAARWARRLRLRARGPSPPRTASSPLGPAPRQPRSAPRPPPPPSETASLGWAAASSIPQVSSTACRRRAPHWSPAACSEAAAVVSAAPCPCPLPAAGLSPFQRRRLCGWGGMALPAHPGLAAASAGSLLCRCFFLWRSWAPPWRRPSPRRPPPPPPRTNRRWRAEPLWRRLVRGSSSRGAPPPACRATAPVASRRPSASPGTLVTPEGGTKQTRPPRRTP